MGFMERLWEGVNRNVAAWEQETAARLAAVEYGEKSLLAFGEGGECFQIIDTGDAFLFVNTDGEHYVTDFEPLDQSLFTAKGSITVPKKEITSIDIGADYDEEQSGIIEYAVIRVRRTVKHKGKKGGKSQRRNITFTLTDAIAEETLRSFFAGTERLSVMPREAFEQRIKPLLTPKERAFRRRLFTVVTVLPVAAILSIPVAAAIPHSVIGKICAAVCALAPLTLLGLFFRLPDWLVLRRAGMPDGRTIDIELPLGVTSFAAAVLTGMGDMFFYNWPTDCLTRWLLTAAVPFGLFTALLFLVPTNIRQSERSESLSRALLLLVYAGMACLSGVYLLNYALDFTPPRSYTATIAEKSAEDEGTRSAQYWITARRREDVCDVFEVTEEEYDRLRYGDTVTVTRHGGALGIPYRTMDKAAGR